MKKKRSYFVCLGILGALICSILVGCSSGPSKAEYDKTISDLTEANDRLAAMEKDNADLQSELDELTQKYEDLQTQVKPYLALSEAEAEAAIAKANQEKAEAEKKLAEQKATEEEAAAKAAAEEAAKKEAEEKMGYETGITYDQLARTPDEYEGKKVKFSGTVVQVMEGKNTVEIRLAVNTNYDKIIYGSYKSNIVSSRVLEDDKITVYGVSNGLITYTSTMGGNITIPSVTIDKIDQ